MTNDHMYVYFTEMVAQHSGICQKQRYGHISSQQIDLFLFFKLLPFKLNS